MSLPARNDSADGEEARWFADELHPHERSLRSYLRGAFPAVRDVDDIVQESYIRTLRARAVTPIRSAAAFLFGVARRLAIDDLRRGRKAAHEAVTDIHALLVLRDEPGVAESVSLRQECSLLAEAIDSLPTRCREIVVLRKLDGLSHREIAGRLGLSEETVQVQIGRGMRKLKAFLNERGVQGLGNAWTGEVTL